MSVESVVDALKSPHDVLLFSKGGNHVLSVVHLLHIPCKIPQRGLLSLEIPLGMFYHLHAHQAANRDDANSNQGQDRADHQHHYEYEYHGTDRCDNLADTLLKGGIYGVHIIGDAA